MTLVRHGVQQIHAGLVLQQNVAFQLRQELLLQLAHGALVLEKVADKEEG